MSLVALKATSKSCLKVFAVFPSALMPICAERIQGVFIAMRTRTKAETLNESIIPRSGNSTPCFLFSPLHWASEISDLIISHVVLCCFWLEHRPRWQVISIEFRKKGGEKKAEDVFHFNELNHPLGKWRWEDEKVENEGGRVKVNWAKGQSVKSSSVGETGALTRKSRFQAKGREPRLLSETKTRIDFFFSLTEIKYIVKKKITN